MFLGVLFSWSGEGQKMLESTKRFRNSKAETSWAALVCRRTVGQHGGGQGGEESSNVHQPHGDKRWSNHTKICIKKR